MIRRRAPLAAAAGFSLIETMWALLIFSIITLGTVPLLLGSLRGATLSRSYSVGKNAGLAAMEGLRNLPYYISYTTQNQKVDILDLYFPSVAGSYDATTKTYTTICTPATTAQPACPKNVPAGYTVTFGAQFVEAGGSSTNESYTPVAPAAGYQWDSNTADSPRSQLLKVNVLTEWTRYGAAKSFRLTGIIGDRKFGPRVRLRSVGQIGYAIQALTTYGAGLVTPEKGLTATGGIGESRLDSGLITTADQNVLAGRISVDTPAPAALSGARSVLRAAPDSAPSGQSQAAQTFVDPDATPTGKAFVNATSTSGLGVGVSGELPHAEGSFGYGTSAPPGNDQELFWASNRITPTPNSYLRLATSSPLDPTASPRLVAVKPLDHDANPVTAPIGLSGRTTALTQASRVLSTAVTNVGRVLLLPTQGGPQAFAGQSIDVSRPLIVIDNFTASVSCDARRTDPSASNSSGTWSATLRYWTDLQATGSTGDGVAAGAYSAPVTLGFPQPAGQPTLAAIKAQNSGKGPLVYDAALNANDVYLFENPGDNLGYLQSWSGLAAVATSTSADGQEVTASMNGAVRLAIRDTDSGVSGSNMSVLLGNLSCQAADRR